MIAATPEEADLALTALKKSLAAEQAHTAINMHLVEAEWLQKMRSSKVKELKSEALEAVAYRRSAAEQHTRTLETLLQGSRDLTAAVAASEASHRQLISSVATQFDIQLQEMQNHAVAAVERIRKDVKEECVAARASHAALCRAVQEDIAELQRAHANSMSRMSSNFSTQKRALLDVWDERCGVARLLGEERLQMLATAAHSEAKSFSTETKDERTRHEALFKEDADDSRVIEAQTKQLEELQRDIREWRQRLAQDAAQWQLHVADAKCVKGAALARHAALQRQVGKDREMQEQRLKVLSLESAHAEEELTEVVERAERVAKALELRAKQVSRKEKEKKENDGEDFW